jgi:hypothetical protein
MVPRRDGENENKQVKSRQDEAKEMNGREGMLGLVLAEQG